MCVCARETTVAFEDADPAALPTLDLGGNLLKHLGFPLADHRGRSEMRLRALELTIIILNRRLLHGRAAAARQRCASCPCPAPRMPSDSMPSLAPHVCMCLHVHPATRTRTHTRTHARTHAPPSEPPSEPLTSPLPAAFSPHSVRDEAEELEDAESAEAEAPGEEEVVETEAPSLRPPSKRSRTAPNRLDATQSKKKAAKTDSKGKGKVLCCQSALIHSLCLSAWVCCAGGGRLEWRWQGN